jgi:hypothetical protein
MLDGGSMAPGLYGSPLSALFVSDAISGANSLDIITIGDSNAGYSYGGFGGCGGGWTRGLLRGLNAAGAQTYGSGMMPIMTNGAAFTAGVVKEDDGSTVIAPFGFFSQPKAATGTLLRGGASGPAAVKAFAVAGSAFLPYGAYGTFDFAYIAPTNTNAAFDQLNATYPASPTFASPTLPTWMQPGTSLKYRVTHARTNTSGGSIVPTVYKVIPAGQSYVSVANATRSTYNDTTDVDNAEVSFTYPTDSPTAGLIFGWNYIGTATGPACAMYDSVYKVTKGIAVTNMHYGSGQTTSTISGIVGGANTGGKTFLESYLQQIVLRQIAAGGSGRVLIWINSGINGPDSGSTWTSGMDTMISTLQAAWANNGYAANNLAFACSVTHPLDTDYGGSTEANLAGARTVANAWALTKTNTTVIDLSRIYTAAQMTAAGYYSGTTTNEAHLSQAGYYAFGQQIINRLAASH